MRQIAPPTPEICPPDGSGPLGATMHAKTASSRCTGLYGGFIMTAKETP